MVLRRLAGQTADTAPVLTLVTQFGGGKTHTLTALYHLASNGDKAASYEGVPDLLRDCRLSAIPSARVAVFIGNAWDPQDGRETPWIDLARQLAGDQGVAELGPAAKDVPPGTEAIARVFQAASGPVLVLLDEVLNFVNRHRVLAEPFYAFLQNLTVAMTGRSQGAAVVSLPRSQVEMTEWDYQWQERITKVVRRVAQDLIANDETEISEVIRRRLFEDLGKDRMRKRVAKEMADWCFDKRAQLPAEWTAVDSATSDSKARDFLQARFEACYPFHPATLSVFQRKWQTLTQYQQTRGTLAMLAQWISWAQHDGFRQARTEPLITLGSAPLDVPEFRGTVLGQLGEARLGPAIEADIAGPMAHAAALDADAKGNLKDIHRRVGAAIFFESSGGQVDKMAHLPELRFALLEPGIDTTSIDMAAMALEAKSFYVRRVGSDGFKVHHVPTLKKVVSDRQASLDHDTEVRPAMEALVRSEFEKGKSIPVEYFPKDGAEVGESLKLKLWVMDPSTEWSGALELRQRMGEWTKQHGASPRLYPGSLVWCLKKQGGDLRISVEEWLARRRVQREIEEGTLGGDFDKAELAGFQTEVKEAEGNARDEVWASYRYVLLADSQEPEGLSDIDLGAGHASAGETLCGRVIAALKSRALLNESVGAGYIERNWPPALETSGAWPLGSLRQAFLDGSLTRLLDPEGVLRRKIVEFVEKGDFGLASGERPDGTYDKLWHSEPVSADEVDFEPGVFLLTKARAAELKKKAGGPAQPERPPGPGERPSAGPGQTPLPLESTTLEAQAVMLRVSGSIPPELWNRLGTKVIPKMKSGGQLEARVEFSVSLDATLAHALESDLRQIVEELGLADRVTIRPE